MGTSQKFCLKGGTPKQHFLTRCGGLHCVHSEGRGEAGLILHICHQQSNLRSEILSLNDSMPNTPSVPIFDRNSVVTWNWIFSIQKSWDFNHASLWITLTETQVSGTSPNRTPPPHQKNKRPMGTFVFSLLPESKDLKTWQPG